MKEADGEGKDVKAGSDRKAEKDEKDRKAVKQSSSGGET